MRREALSSVCGLAMLIAGCPKRQAGPRINYVPAPAPAAAPASTASQQTLVIEEPAPPSPPAKVSAQPTPAKPVRPRRRPARTEPQPAPVEPGPEAEEPAPTAEVPALEPGGSSEEESGLRTQIQGMQEDIRQRLSRLDPAKLSAADRKTFEDARTFFAQSGKALEESDLQRALNLARKASLLVAALER